MIAFLLQDTRTIYGAERATIDLATGLVARGRSLIMILIRETRLGEGNSALEKVMRAAGLEVAVLETDRRFSMGLVGRIGRMLDERGVRILHTVGYKADVHGAFAVGSDVKQVSTVHGWLFRPHLKERLYGWINIKVLRKCARVVVLSRYYEDLLAKKGLNVTRIPSGMDLAPAATIPRDPEFFTIGMMGRFSQEKNHAMFLRAAVDLARSTTDIRFLLAGDGPLRAQTEDELTCRGLEDRAVVEGYVPGEEFLQRIDCLVMCSRIENLPYSVMEAMAHALPVVATDVGGLPDLVEDGRNGYLVPSNDDVALAAKIALLAGDHNLAERMGRAGREKLQREFSREQMLTRHETLYSSL